MHASGISRTSVESGSWRAHFQLRAPEAMLHVRQGGCALCLIRLGLSVKQRRCTSTDNCRKVLEAGSC
eukprot:14415184-Alexandrium_andersonii.AAC.1